MRLSEDRQREVSLWQPFMIYTWTKAQLQLWYDMHGSFALYNGKMWQPVSKNNAYPVRAQ